MSVPDYFINKLWRFEKSRTTPCPYNALYRATHIYIDDFRPVRTFNKDGSFPQLLS